MTIIGLDATAHAFLVEIKMLLWTISTDLRSSALIHCLRTSKHRNRTIPLSTCSVHVIDECVGAPPPIVKGLCSLLARMCDAHLMIIEVHNVSRTMEGKLCPPYSEEALPCVAVLALPDSVHPQFIYEKYTSSVFISSGWIAYSSKQASRKMSVPQSMSLPNEQPARTTCASTSAPFSLILLLVRFSSRTARSKRISHCPCSVIINVVVKEAQLRELWRP
jgi:hypothetical protein